MADKIYDVAIVGSGPAGYTAAIRAGQFGLKTALIEKDNVLGGTCLHVGCIPTKALLFNAEIYDHLKDAAEFGIEGLGTPKLNWPKIQDRKDKIVTKHTKGLDFLMRKNKVDVIRGYGKLTGPAKNGVVTVDVEDGGAKIAGAGEERAAGERVGSAHDLRAEAGRSHSDEHRNSIAQRYSKISHRGGIGRRGRGIRVDLQLLRHESDGSGNAAAHRARGR